MSPSHWAELVKHCHPVSNVSLLCRDGVVSSHKIVLASVSDFVKSLLSDIPVGDDVSVFLPDSNTEDVGQFLENVLLLREHNNYDLCSLLLAPLSSADHIKSNENLLFTDVELKEVDEHSTFDPPSKEGIEIQLKSEEVATQEAVVIPFSKTDEGVADFGDNDRNFNDFDTGETEFETKVYPNEKKDISRRPKYLKFYLKWNVWDHWKKNTNTTSICIHCDYEMTSKRVERLVDSMKIHTTQNHADKLSLDHQEHLARRRLRQQKKSMPSNRNDTRISTVRSYFSEDPESPLIYTCNLCQDTVTFNQWKSEDKLYTNKVYTDQMNLKLLFNHMAEYHDLYKDKAKRPHVCPDCGKKFASAFNLERHLPVHTGNWKFFCPHPGCSSGFMSQNSEYRLHVQSHSSERPHLCTICGSSFRTKLSLKNHMMVELGKSKFECSYCKKQFPQKRDLSDHLLTHTGERPHECKECGKRFVQKVHLRTHMKLVHTVKI